MGKKQYAYKFIAMVAGERSIDVKKYPISNDAVIGVKKQIENTDLNSIVFYPTDFDGMPFRVNVSETFGVTIEKKEIKTESGIIGSAEHLVDLDGKPLKN